MEIFTFALTYLVICNWFQLISFFSLFLGPKYRTSSVDDKWIKHTVKKKTGLSLLNITIFHDNRMHGMMPGLPFWPKMILSERLYTSLNKDELEWVILHEAAHCVLWHNLQFFLIQISMLAFGIYIISLFNISLFFSILFSIFLALISIQLFRWGIEYFADKYSILRVDNPRGVITAQEKFIKANSKHFFSSEKSILRFLLSWNIYPSLRIKMAKQKLQQRS